MTRPGFRSLHSRLLWGAILVAGLVMAAVMGVVEHRQRFGIIAEVERRGEVLARSLAATSYGPLLLYNYTALEQNVARVAAEADVMYAIVLDAEGKVAAHSHHPERVSFSLQGKLDSRAAATERPLTQETVSGGQAIFDFAVPVLVDRQRWGTVRVGLSKQRMEKEIRNTRWELGTIALATLLVGGVAAALVARRITRPVRQLAEGADAISRGELYQRIEPTTRDEIGRLAVAFNHMAAQLVQQHAALEAGNAELRRRLEEIVDFKSYTDNLLASLTSGIVTVDLEGRVVTLNPAAELLTGFFAGEVIGHYCSEVFAHAPGIGDMLMETLASRTATPGATLTLQRRNGTTVPVEFSAVPLKGGEGKDLGVIGIFRDLSAVRDLEEQLRRSDRLVAIGTLAAGLAHEIKNPLTSLLTFTRRLARKFDDEQFQVRFQSVVPRELERINGIVEGLLDLARPSRLSLRRLHLPGLLERVTDLYAHELDTQGVTVRREYARDVSSIVADAEALYQAVVNLVANALEAMPRGGELTLRVGWAEAPAPRRPHALHPTRRVQVEVGDTGGGISPSLADRVFNPFFTTKKQGTGLGLALTHKIVEDHGGTVTFTSAPGHGTTFRIVLPLIPDLLPDSDGDEGDLM